MRRSLASTDNGLTVEPVYAHAMKTEVQSFVDAYASALATGDGETIASHYDSHVVFVSDGMSYAAANDDAFAEWFTSTSATYRERGFGDPAGVVTRVEVLSPAFLLAWVTWHYRSDNGAPMFDADYVYGLRRDPAGKRLIHAVWSLNEAERAAAYIAARE